MRYLKVARLLKLVVPNSLKPIGTLIEATELILGLDNKIKKGLKGKIND